MKPKRIVLVRHGNSQANADKHIRAEVPDHLIELTPEGNEQSFVLGRELKKLFGDESIYAYISPYKRTRQTWEGIKWASKLQGGLDIRAEYEDPRIREQDFGHLRAMEAFALIDAERSAYGTFFYRIPDGESGADVYDRLSGFLDTLWRDFEKTDYPENAVLMIHGLTIRLFLMRWFHWSVEKFELLRNPNNCEYFVLELQRDGKYKLLNPLREYAPGDAERWRLEAAGKLPVDPTEQKKWMR